MHRSVKIYHMLLYLFERAQASKCSQVGKGQRERKSPEADLLSMEPTLGLDPRTQDHDRS